MGSPLAVLVLAGCDSRQNVLDPAAKAERSIAGLWWWMLGAAWIGFGVVALLLVLGWFRRNRPNLPFGGTDRAATVLIVVLGVAVPIVALTILFVFSDLVVLRTTDAPGATGTAMKIDVVGRQWFWEVRYPGTRAVTANEIHIPARTPVTVVGTTRDVIHSFWVPELNGKIDLIPGRENRVLLDADRPGVFRGQCAEFCGVQHAHMALRVVAEPPAAYRAWLAGQSRPARAPSSPGQRRGQRVFTTSACSGCHTVRGTAAQGTAGPDLTHLASRQTLAADTIENTPDQLAGWLADPQHVKPGNHMPNLELPAPELRDLVAYLDSLH